jgi:hypothetical protein
MRLEACFGVQGVRCRANSAHIRQSGPESGPGFQVKQLKTLKLFPFRSLRAINTPFCDGSCFALRLARRVVLSNEPVEFRTAIPKECFAQQPFTENDCRNRRLLLSPGSHAPAGVFCSAVNKKCFARQSPRRVLHSNYHSRPCWVHTASTPMRAHPEAGSSIPRRAHSSRCGSYPRRQRCSLIRGGLSEAATIVNRQSAFECSRHTLTVKRSLRP